MHPSGRFLSMSGLRALPALLVSILPAPAHATIQHRDILIAGQDTFYIEEDLLALPVTPVFIRHKLRSGCVGPQQTACARGYSATWLLEGSRLYLTGVCCNCALPDKLWPEALLPDSVKKHGGRIAANWISGIVSAGRKLFFAAADAPGAFYREEVTWRIKGGIIIGERWFRNRSRPSEYSSDRRKLTAFIHRSIDWSRLPAEPDGPPVRVVVRFSANADGRISRMKIFHPVPAPYALEAERVLRALPSWEVLFRHGKFLSVPWYYVIVFDEEAQRYND